MAKYYKQTAIFLRWVAFYLVFIVMGNSVSQTATTYPPQMVIEPQLLRIHHGFSGFIKTQFDRLLEGFNKEHPQFRAEGKTIGNYSLAIKEALAQDPLNPHAQLADFYHISEYGAQTFIKLAEQGKLFVSVGKILPELNHLRFLGQLELNYGSVDKSLLHAIPFNPSMGIAYYNVEAFQKAGLDPHIQLTTWDGIENAGIKLKAAGYTGFTFPWIAAYTYEYLGSMHNRFVLSNENGFLPIERKNFVKFIIDRDPEFGRFFERLFRWHQQGIFHYESDQSDKAEEFFAKGKCGILMQGSGRLSAIKATIAKHAIAKNSPPFSIAFGPLPCNHTIIEKPYAPKIGGGAFWASRDTPGVRAFLQYIIRTDIQKQWSEWTGYIPATLSAHYALEKSGYYKKEPQVLMAVEQLLTRPSGFVTHFRLENYPKVREEIFPKLFRQYLQDPKAKGAEFVQEFSDKVRFLNLMEDEGMRFVKEFTFEANQFLKGAGEVSID